LTGEQLFALPGGGTAPRKAGNRLYFTPACPIIAQNFNNAADVNGAKSDPSSTGWYLDTTKVPNATYFAVKSHRLKAQTLKGEGVWYSQPFSISGYTGVQFDVKISNEGTKSSSEYVKVYHKLNGGPEILDTAMYGDMGTPLVTSLPMTGSTVQIVVRIYDTTAGNSEYYIEQYDVFKETAPCTVSGITVTTSNTNGANGVLTCAYPSTTLTANTTATGTTTYSWTGPNSFSATGASVTVSTAGTYTVTGTNSAGVGTSTITVTSNTTAPAGVTASASGSLTCSNVSVTLTGGSSTTSGVNFAWAGPSGFSANSATATATVPGIYTVTATSTSSGCTASASTAVAQNITAPAVPLLTSNPVSAKLTCTATSIALNANSSNPKVGYTWTGPGGFTFTGMTTSVNVPGTYTVTARDSTNGCTSTSSAVVTQDTARPSSVLTSSSPANGQLTCSVNSVVLTGSSATTGVTYAWAGPNGFTASGASATVTAIGNYTVTVTNPNTGCSTSVTAPTITQNTTVPSAVNATVNDRLTCNTTSVKISASSTTAGVTYAWTGPGGFTSNLKETFVSVGGVYTVTATDPSNGCSFSRQITVQADQVHPQGVTVSSDGSLSCSAGSVTLTGNSSTTGVTYTWTGPNGFFDPEQITSVVDSGTYLLTVSSSSNGCNTTASIVVTADFTGCSAAIRKAVNGHAVTLDGAGGSTAGVSGLTYKVYPNPASRTAVVELNVPEKGHVSVEVYNGVGVREKMLFDGNVEAGTPYRWTLDTGSLSVGVYYCMIRTKNKTYVSKLLTGR